MAIDFTKQVGPLPLGAWAVLVPGGLAVAFFAANRKKAEANAQGFNLAPTRSVDADPGVGEGFAGFVNALQLPPAAAPTGPTTNEAWARDAINYLISQGADPTAADAAIRKYVTSQSLSAQERALVNMALKFLGSPPSPLATAPPELPAGPKPPIVVPPTPKPPPPATKPYRIHIVSKWNAQGSSLWSIALKYYGNGNRWPEIYAANKKGITRVDGQPGFIINPHYLRPGDRVLVP